MTDEQQQLVCVATFLAKRGKDELLQAELMTLMAPTRAETGCLRYELNRSIDNPRQFVFVEKFADDAAFEFHGAQDYLDHLRSEVIPKLVQSVDVVTYREIGL
jgi:quinol monooxygenase YgiN